MRTTILMASIAVLLAGGGAAFAQSGQLALAPGLATVSEPTSTDWSGKVFDQPHQAGIEAHEKVMSDETARIQRQLEETRRRYPPGFLQKSPEIAP